MRRDPATASYQLLRARFSPDGGRIAYDLMIDPTARAEQADIRQRIQGVLAQ